MLDYEIWSRSWCDTEVDLLPAYEPGLRTLLPSNWSGSSETDDLAVRLVPETHEGRPPETTISIRAGEVPLGYLGGDVGSVWLRPLQRIVASSLIPTTQARIWGTEFDGWDGTEFRATLRVALGDPALALPLNDPPVRPYTLVPRSGLVQVTKEDEHFDVLSRFVPACGHGALWVTLVERTPPTGKGKPHVEVQLDGERIGQLTPAMSQRFLPMIRHLAGRGLLTACWGDITGSSVAAEVRIDAVKANEANSSVLEGPPVNLPELVQELPIPFRYGLSNAADLVRPRSPVPPPRVENVAEPPDGSVIRFSKSRGRYLFVAVRRGSCWETSATSNDGSIRQVMTWADLGTRLPRFEVAASWDTARPLDPRAVQLGATVWFAIGRDTYTAVNIADDCSSEGDWYTTVTDAASERTRRIGKFATWSEILAAGPHVQIVTDWQSR